MRPLCPGDADGVRLYAQGAESCSFCGLLFAYMGDEEFEESDEVVIWFDAAE